MAEHKRPHPLIITHQHRDSDNYYIHDQVGTERGEPYDTTLRRPADRPFNEAYRFLTQKVHENREKVLFEVLRGSSEVQVTCTWRWYLLNYTLCTDAGLYLFHTVFKMGPNGPIGGVNPK